MLGITEDTKISNRINEGTNVSKGLSYTGYKDNSKQLHSRRQKRERTATVNKIPKKGTTTLLHRFRILAHLDFESGHLRKFSWRRQTLKQGLQGGIKF